MATLIATLLLFITQAGLTLTGNGNFPSCQQVRIMAPNGNWALVSPPNPEFCPKEDKGKYADFEPKLFLMNESNHRKRLVMRYSSGGDVGWAPGSMAFFVNEQVGSNVGDAYIYGTASLKKLDLTDVIFRSDSAAAKFKIGHRYVRARKWIDDHSILVQFCGHTDESPVIQFDFRYRVTVTGQVQTLFQKKGAPDLDECAWNEH
jgi:hypothetical protein